MPKRRGFRRRRSAEQWRRVLHRLAKSGLSARDFCRAEGLSLSSLQRWRARLCGPPAGTGFVELTGPPAPPSLHEAWAVELVLPHGVSLRLRG